jgi:hypothetical protein
MNEAPLALSQTLAILCYGHPMYQAMGRPTEPAAIEAFSRFCSEAAHALRARTRFFEIWNEWNVVTYFPLLHLTSWPQSLRSLQTFVIIWATLVAKSAWAQT